MEVIPQGEVAPLPVLLVPSIQRQEGNRPLKVQPPHGQGRKFAPSEPGQEEGLVDQAPFPSQATPGAPEPYRPRWRRLVSSACPDEWSWRRAAGLTAGSVEQLDQFCIIESPASATAVGVFIRLDDASERVDGKPTVRNAPVDQGVPAAAR